MQFRHLNVLSILLCAAALTIAGCREDNTGPVSDQSFLTTPTIFVPFGILNTPRGITVDASGNVWVADTRNNVIRRFSPSGLQGDSIVGFSNPTYMGYDRSTNTVLVVVNNGTILRINPQTNAATPVLTLSSSNIDTTYVYNVNTFQYQQRIVSAPVAGDLDAAPNGDIFVSIAANSFDNAVVRIRNGQATSIAYSDQPPATSAQGGTRFFAMDRFGSAYTMFLFGSPSSPAIPRAYTLRPDNVSFSRAFRDEFVSGEARGAAVDAAGLLLFVADPPSGEIVVLSTGGERALDFVRLPVITGITRPAAWDIGVGPDGSVYAVVGEYLLAGQQVGAVVRYFRTSRSS